MKKKSLLHIIFAAILILCCVSCSSKEETEVRKTITTVIQAANEKNTELLIQTAPFLKNYEKTEVEAYAKLWRSITKNKYKIKNISGSSEQYFVQIITTDDLGSKSDVYTFSISKQNEVYTLNESFEVDEPTIFIEYMDFSDKTSDTQQE